METKLFEVRDRKTFVVVMCTRLSPSNEADRYLLAMTGFGLREEVQQRYFLYAGIKEGRIAYGIGDHNMAVRTHPIAHAHIEKHWEELTSGDVIDVEFILGEAEAPKISQRLEKC